VVKIFAGTASAHEYNRIILGHIERIDNPFNLGADTTAEMASPVSVD
jgi:hypothetical protein